MMVPFKAKEKVEADVNVQRPYSCNSWLASVASRNMHVSFILLDLLIPICLCEDALSF